MNPNWRSFLESAAGSFDSNSSDLLNFGDAAGELQAAAGQTVLVPLTHLGLIEANGEDVKSFLHSQLTSDINHLAEERAQHSGWCTAKGRLQASFLVWRAGENYRLLLAADLQEATQKRLQMFVLRAKVKLAALTEENIVLGVAGRQAAEALSDAGLPIPGEAMATASQDGVTVIRLENTRFLVIAPQAAQAALWQKLSIKAKPAGVPVWRWLDVEAAYPLVTLATKEEFVPQMADFDKIGGVSFQKGCYPGQEIVARTQYLGKVKRHLFRLSSQHPLQAGDPLYSPENMDQTIGTVMSVAAAPGGGFAALGVVQSNHADNVHLESREGPQIQAVAVNP